MMVLFFMVSVWMNECCLFWVVIFLLNMMRFVECVGFVVLSIVGFFVCICV